MIRALMMAGLLVTTLGACGGGGGGNGVPDTIGEVCLEFGDAVCGRLAECDDEVDRDACETAFYGACCSDDDVCDEDVGAGAPSDDDYNECLGDIDDQSCPQIANGELPPSCDGF
jgi:hypothetical protein